MKKLLVLTIILLLTLTLGGCKSDQGIDSSNLSTAVNNINNEKKVGPISIQSVSIDDEEYTVLKAGGVQTPMIFSVDLGGTPIKEIMYWIDYYRDGEQVNSFLNVSSFIQTESTSSTYKFYFSTSQMYLNNEIWTLSLRENNNLDTGRYELESSEYDSTIIHPIGVISTSLNEAADLGMIVRNLGMEQFGASDDVNRTIKENKEVYVIRCMFK